MDRNIYVPPGGPPQGSPPPREVFAIMGQDKIYQLLADFYIELGNSDIKHLFPQNEKGRLDNSKKSAAFFVGLLGGPPLYHQTYGPPRMRMRHMPFVIRESDRKIWVATFKKVLDRDAHNFPKEHLPAFLEFLETFSGWMTNSAD